MLMSVTEFVACLNKLFRMARFRPALTCAPTLNTVRRSAAGYQTCDVFVGAGMCCDVLVDAERDQIERRPAFTKTKITFERL
jgi:hypothetical protein